MGSEVSTIQSLKAVDAWIDVINANINGGVRTGFKSSRLKFGGSNVDIVRAGTGTSLPLQLPEAGLNTTNTVIDFSQGAVTASTENTHLAIQGEGFFLLAPPGAIAADGTILPANTNFGKLYVTRDGEFRTNQNGLLVNSAGYFLVAASVWTAFGFGPIGSLKWRGPSGWNGQNTAIRAVYNNVDTTSVATVAQRAINLSDFLANTYSSTMVLAGGAGFTMGVNPFNTSSVSSILKVTGGKQSLMYSQFGSTIYDMSTNYSAAVDNVITDPAFTIASSTTSDATILSKSLEASNASMTQSVPELSLAQKLFSALTKVLQTKQTNVDGVLNLIR